MTGKFNVGTLDSEERGSTARDNKDKTEWAYMPLDQIAYLAGILQHAEPDESADDFLMVLDAIGVFQVRQNFPAATNLLVLAFRQYMASESITFVEACARVIKVWKVGEEKYAAFNWMKGSKWSVPLNSAYRHAMSYWEGNIYDKESGLNHQAHLICNIMMLVHYVSYYPEGNDLPLTEYFLAV